MNGIERLDDSAPETDRDAAWASEIRRRLDAYDAGKAHAVTSEDVLRDLEAIAGGGRT